jgi:large repetitive protein
VTMKVYNQACSFYQTVTIGTPSGNVPLLHETITPSPCNNTSGGSIELNPSGGLPPFSYRWKDIPDENNYNSTDRDQHNLFPGIYQLIVTDFAGCDYSFSFTVPKSDGPVKVTQGSVTPVSTCAGNANGSGTVQITGGNPPYTQTWIDNNTQSFADGSVLHSGSYKVIATDQSGCTGYSYIHIPSENPPLHIDLLDSSKTVLACDSINDGSLHLCIHGGIQPYQVDTPWTILSNIISQNNLSAGDYPLLITDSIGCIFSDTLQVTSPQLLFNASAVHTTCIGCTNGQINISYSGGVPPFTFTWSPSIGQLNGTAIEQLPAGVYDVCISDSNQCSICSSVQILDDPLRVEHLNTKTISVFPNPTTGAVTITVINHEQEKLFLDILDIYGKKTTTMFYSGEELNNLKLADGLYFLIIKIDDESIAGGKLVVNH